jgi:hypothetical protein
MNDAMAYIIFSRNCLMRTEPAGVFVAGRIFIFWVGDI